jgi:hypothetical protein
VLVLVLVLLLVLMLMLVLVVLVFTQRTDNLVPCTLMHIYACTQTNLHRHKHTHTHSHSHTHTHTHSYLALSHWPPKTLPYHGSWCVYECMCTSIFVFV